jgi:CRP-like cAMP-binding protein
MPAQPNDQNAFLSRLSVPEFALLRPHLTAVDLQVADELQRHGSSVDHVIFPHSGLVALTMPMREHGGAGAILVGQDSIVGGLAAVAAAPANCDADVYVGGRAARMSASAFRDVLDQAPVIRRLAAQFDSALMARAQQAALCNAAHPVEARVCRWLLDLQDRIGSSKVPLIQGALAQMLGVRRTTVTLTAAKLESAGTIKWLRGHVQIMDREQLEQHSCECYGHVEGYIARLFAEHDRRDRATGSRARGLPAKEGRLTSGG